MGSLRIFGNNGKIGLTNTVFHGTVHVLTNSRIKQCLLYRCTRHLAENIIEHIHCHIKLSVKAGSHGNIVCQISVFMYRLILHHRVFLLQFPFCLKRLLKHNFGIHRKCLKCIQIILIHKGKVLCRVQITIQINKTVGGMIKLFVEGKEFLIAKLRNHLRVASGFQSIGNIGI